MLFHLIFSPVLLRRGLRGQLTATGERGSLARVSAKQHNTNPPPAKAAPLVLATKSPFRDQRTETCVQKPQGEGDDPKFKALLTLDWKERSWS